MIWILEHYIFSAQAIAGPYFLEEPFGQLSEQIEYELSGYVTQYFNLELLNIQIRFNRITFYFQNTQPKWLLTLFGTAVAIQWFIFSNQFDFCFCLLTSI